MEVSVEQLHLHYGDFHAINGIDLHVPDGTSLVLLGPSGCGKTTTMRSIAGLEQPSGGTISIGGTKLFDAASNVNVPPNKRNIGMVFQSYAVWPNMSVRQNVEFPLKMQKRSKREIATAVDAVLELAGLTQYASRGASQLSGGQMQRVALARSLVMRPSVLLFDEPLSNLDALLRESLRNELRRIQLDAGATSIYVTHDQSEAMALGDTIAMMRGGEVVQLGGPSDLYERPVDKDVALFMGFDNVFPIVGGEGVARLLGRGVTLASETGDGEFLCVRSENVRIERLAPAVEPPAGGTTGTVSTVLYQGRFMEYEVEIANGLLVRSRRFGRDEGIARGDSVSVRLDESHALTLKGA
jgi:iron(III) transport system ATP-binding protein